MTAHDDAFDRAVEREAELRTAADQREQLMTWAMRNNWRGSLKGVAFFALTLPLHLLIVGWSLTISIYIHVFFLTACAIGAANGWINASREPVPRRHGT